MIRVIILVLVLIGLTIGGFYYRFAFVKNTRQDLTQSQPREVPLTNEEEDSTSTEDIFEKLAESKAKSDELNKSIDPTNKSLEDRIKLLEASLTVLERRQDIVEKASGITTGSTTTSGSTGALPPSYIPLGSGGSTSATDWTSVDNLDVIIDPADYPGYKSMRLEVSLRTFQGNGQAYARLYNNDDGLAIPTSEVSTTSQDYNWQNSATFKLNSGKKTYKIQLKTLTGYEASVQSARIRVNF